MVHVPEHPEFMKTVKDIRGAEEEYDRIVNSAKEEADRIMRDAKEKILEERNKNNDAAVAYKNDQLKKGSSEIENEVNEVIAKARSDGDKLSKKKIDGLTIKSIVKDFLTSL